MFLCLMIAILVAVCSVAGFIYLTRRISAFGFIKKLSKDKKVLKYAISAGLIVLTGGIICLSGSLEVGSNEFNNSGNYSIQMTDGYDDDLCRELTRIKRDGAKIPYTNDQHSFNFNRMYDASNKDITLQLWFENSAYNTYLGGFRGTITITALD